MPGLIPHLLAGSAMILIGRRYYTKYFHEHPSEIRNLIIVSLICSILPDFFLGIYYTFKILPFSILLQYHQLLHLIMTPTAIVILLALQFKIDIKRRPIWTIGLCCILLHIVMDSFIQEHGVLL